MIAVGLILGTRMWYAMWDAEHDDDAAFERRVDSVTREIGERGKLKIPESVPPVRETAPTPAPTPAVAPVPTRAPAPAPATSPTTGPATAPSLSPTSTLVSQQPGTAATTPNFVSSVDQRPTQVQLSSSSASVAASGMGASLMEVSAAFMMEQLKAQVVEQRAHDNEQHAEMLRLLVEREAKLEAQRKDLEAKLEAQRQGYETKLEAQRNDLEAKFRAKLEKQRRETQVQARTGEVTRLQLRLEVLNESKLLEDEELSALFDKVADAIEAVATEDGADRAWDCVMQMIRLSEGIASEKMFAQQLRRKFL